MSTRYTYIPSRLYLNGRSRENDSHSEFLAPMAGILRAHDGRRLPNETPSYLASNVTLIRVML